MMKSCRNSSYVQTLVHNKCRIAPRVIAICGTFALAVGAWINVSVCRGHNASTGAIAGAVTGPEAVKNLPLAVRNYTQIIGLNPGVSTDVTNASQLGRGDDISSVVSGGVPNKDNNIQLDGVQANDRQQSGQFGGGAPVPNPDSIQEFKVQTSQYDASFGRDAGANVHVVTKRGSNTFHGNACEYFRDTVMNADDFFVKNAVLNQNQL